MQSYQVQGVWEYVHAQKIMNLYTAFLTSAAKQIKAIDKEKRSEMKI